MLGRRRWQRPSTSSAPIVCLVCALAIVGQLTAAAAENGVGGVGRVISTRYGQLQGLRIARPADQATPAAGSPVAEVDAYLGVEYASLRGGALRFMPPGGPTEKWRGVRVAATFKPVCPQRDLNESALESSAPAARLERLRRIGQFLRNEAEECLFLNVYVPVTESQQSKMAVMVFVHGESYDFGSGNAYDGSVLAAFGQVVVITLNYRLGPLGFLSGGGGMTGNYALFDLIAALHWVKANINDFNGDKERVTIFGQGHGAALVHMLTLSPVVKDLSLFQRAILQSGTAVSGWSLSGNSQKTFAAVAEKAGCTPQADRKECLRQSPAKLLMNAAAETSLSAFGSVSGSGPVADGSVLFPAPLEALMAGDGSAFSRAELMVGVTRSEGLALLSQMQLERGLDEATFGDLLRRFVADTYSSHQREIYEILSHQYSDWERSADGPETGTEIRDKLADILTDALYVSPAVKASLAHAALRDTFFYVFAHSSDEERFPEWSGGAHGEELPFVFGAPLLRPDGNGGGGRLEPFAAGPYTAGERQLSEAVMRMWTNFAKTGNPNFPVTAVEPNNGFSELFWPKYEEQRQDYFHIGMRPAVHHHYRNRKVALWLQLVARLQQYAAEDDQAPYGQGQSVGRESAHESSGGERNGSARGLEVRHAVLIPIPPPPPPPFLMAAAAATTATDKPPSSNAADSSASSAEGARTTAVPATAHTTRGSVSQRAKPVATKRVTTATTAADDDVTPAVPDGGGNGDGDTEDLEDVTAADTDVGAKESDFSILLTAVVGSALLVVNAVVLGAIIYWRRRRASRSGKYFFDDGRSRLGRESDGGQDESGGGSSSPLRPSKTARRDGKALATSSAAAPPSDETGRTEPDAGSCRRGGTRRANGDCHGAVAAEAQPLRRSEELHSDGRSGRRTDLSPVAVAGGRRSASGAASPPPPTRHCNGSLASGADSDGGRGGERKRRGPARACASAGLSGDSPSASRGECDSSSEQGVTMV